MIENPQPLVINRKPNVQGLSESHIKAAAKSRDYLSGNSQTNPASQEPNKPYLNMTSSMLETLERENDTPADRDYLTLHGLKASDNLSKR